MARDFTYAPHPLRAPMTALQLQRVEPTRYKSNRRMTTGAEKGGSTGGVRVPDFPARLSYIAHNIRRNRPLRMVRMVIGEDIVYEEQYLAAKRSGAPDSMARQRAMDTAVQFYDDKQDLPSAMRYPGYADRNFIHQLMAQGENMPPTLSALNPAGAPTIENARSAGLAGPAVSPAIGPRGVATSGLGASRQQISQTRAQGGTARQTAERLRSGELPDGYKRYRSVDGNDYVIQVRTPDGPAVKGAMMTVLVHAMAEIVKGGNPIRVLGACLTTVQDEDGKEVVNFQDILLTTYGNETDGDDETAKGVGFS